MTEYHVEAAIASLHASARSMAQTDWSRIVGLYDTLMTLRPSPVVALNRAIAIGQHEGAERGLDAIHAIDDRDRLTAYPFYFAAMGDMELCCERRDAARLHFRTALALRGVRPSAHSSSIASTRARLARHDAMSLQTGPPGTQRAAARSAAEAPLRPPSNSRLTAMRAALYKPNS